MTTAAGLVAHSDLDQIRLHATLRFAVGVTAAFILAEIMGWAPTFLPPVLTAVLMANLPMRPPLKLGIGLVVIMGAAALYAFGASSVLRGTPEVLFGLMALTIFLAFHGMLSGKPALPATLLLICLATIPVIVLVAPAYGSILPVALVRAIAVAVAILWIMHSLLPRTHPPVAPVAPAPGATPVETALLSTAVILPVMLVYLLFGWADALPVLVTTVLLVANFDLQRGRMQALGMIFGNFAGGLVGLVLYALVLTTPTLPVLALLLFATLLWFGRKISLGGPAAGVAVVACNAMLIILSSSLAAEPGTVGIWLTRLFQFVLAGVFAVAMMTLIHPRATPGQAA